MSKGDEPLEIALIKSSCGCASVTLDVRRLEIDKGCVLKYSMSINPAFTVPEKYITVTLQFSNGCMFKVNNLVRSFTHVEAGKRDLNRSSLEGGDIVVEIADDLTFSKQLQIFSVCRQSVSEVPRIVRVYPEDFDAVIQNRNEPVPIMETIESELPLVRQEMLLTLSGKLVGNYPRHVQLEFEAADRSRQQLSFVVHKKRAVQVAPQTVVLTPNRKNAFVTLTRLDEKSLNVIREKIEPGLKLEVWPLMENSGGPSRPSTKRYKLSVGDFESTTMQSTNISFVMDDGELAVVKVVFLGFSKGE